MSFSSDIDIFLTRMNSLNTRLKELDGVVSDHLAEGGEAGVSKDDFDAKIYTIERDFVKIDKIDDIMKAEVARQATVKFTELNGTAVEILANTACDERFERFNDDLVSKSGIDEWLNDNLNEHVNSCLDDLMCEKTQRTIEEYNLINDCQLSDSVSEAMACSDYMTSDSLDDCLHERAESLKDEIREELCTPDDVRELISDAFGDMMTRYWEDSDIYEDIAKYVKSQLIVDQVSSDRPCLERVKYELEKSGVIVDGMIKDKKE